MKFRRVIATLGVVALASAGVAACSPTQETSTEVLTTKAPATTSEAVQESSSESAVKTVTDELGREVTIPADPERILVLNMVAMQALMNLGIMPVGKVEGYGITEEGMALPSVGDGAEINIEKVHELQPDLIFANARYQAALVDQLEQTGAVVYFFDPDSVGDVPLIDITGFLGELLGKEKEATEYEESAYALAEGYKEQLTSQTDIASGMVLQPGDSIKAAQNSTPYGSILNLLGIENIVPDGLPNAQKASFVDFGVEDILAAQPDIVLVVAPAKNPDAAQGVMQKFQNDPQWATLRDNGTLFMVLPASVNPNLSTMEVMLADTTNAILEQVNASAAS